MSTTSQKTPGVYINEINAFPNSVVEVATAVPAFIGYTESASSGGKSLLDVPTRITSMSEFTSYFGGAYSTSYAIDDKATRSDSDFTVVDMDKVKEEEKYKYYKLAPDKKYSLYNNMRFFFQNGGGACYVVSVGDYSKSIAQADLQRGLDKLQKEQEPTMIVIPEAVQLEDSACYALQQQVLLHCEKMQSRIGILDVFGGYKELTAKGTPVGDFRDNIGANALKWGAAYFPWLNTSVIQSTEVNYTWITKPSDTGAASLATLITADVTNRYTGTKLDEAIKYIGYMAKAKAKPTPAEPASGTPPATGAPVEMIPSIEAVDQTLLVISPLYKTIMDTVRAKANLLPPSAAMAGIYTMVDNTRGVWKAPANVSLASVISPTVNISHDDQEDLNVPLNGKAVNAIRPFVGEGILVWGARTLDGNSQDWRYINVRRTMIMLEQSIKIACKAYVFEPNDANTWVGVKSMINNFLTGQWKAGALVGAKPDEAFDVQIGLGATMTADDILNGYMNITVKVAISHPAEFIVITFQQQQQKS